MIHKDLSRIGTARGSANGSAGRASCCPRYLRTFGLLALMLGLLLLDRSFAAWRDDPRTFPDQNGRYVAKDSALVGIRHLNRLAFRRTVAISGLVLLTASILIFATHD